VTNLEPYSGNTAVPREIRRTGRAIRRYQSGGLIRTAAVDADADVAQAKVDNLTMVTGAAMSAVVRVAQAQRQLEMLAPEAAGRLAMLADDHVLGISETLADLRRDTRRR
jgi:hypothetical protein